MTARNPFECEPIRFGRKLIRPVETGVEGRLQRVQRFTATECRAALKLPDLQKTVRVAIERRLRKLESKA